MVITCTHCGHANRVGLLGGAGLRRCDCCGSILASATDPDAAPRRVGWGWVLATILLSALLAGIALRSRAARLAEERTRWQATLATGVTPADGAVKRQSEREAAEREADRAHRARLADADWVTGAAARRQHDAEWARRVAHDPELAASPLEQNLIRMEKLGRDPSVTALRALKEVATLASPPKSRVEVLPFQDRFIVKVAFAHASVVAGEAGGATRHTSVASLRQEARDMSAAIVRDVFAACGSRGIEKLTVSYNRGLTVVRIPEGATAEEKARLAKNPRVLMTRLYRVAVDNARAAGVSDWTSVPLARVRELLQVEHDGLSGVKFTAAEWSSGLMREPEGELEF